MKQKLLLFILPALMLGIFSCKKGNMNNTASLTGKWQEIKLRIYIVDSGKITYDTTYLQPFTQLDYLQFKDEDSCVWSSDHYYYDNAPGEPKTPQLIAQSIINYRYTTIGGGKFVLNTPTLLNPGGFVTTDTLLEVNSNNILVHNVFYSHAPGYELITDSYFQK